MGWQSVGHDSNRTIFWHGPYHLVPFFSLTLRYMLHLPNWLTVHACRQHVLWFFPSHLKPIPTPGTRWALNNACSTRGTKPGDKEKGEELALQGSLGRTRTEVYISTCRHTACIAGCPGGHWLPTLNLAQVFNGPFLALHPTKKIGGILVILRKP